MSPLRIIPAHLAHQLSNAQPCKASYTFPGDEVAARCRLTLGEHRGRLFHEDTTSTRMWTDPDARGDRNAMLKPGSPALRAEVAS